MRALRIKEGQTIHQIRSIVSVDKLMKVWFRCGQAVMCNQDKDGRLTPAFGEKGLKSLGDSLEITEFKNCKKCFVNPDNSRSEGVANE